MIANFDTMKSGLQAYGGRVASAVQSSDWGHVADVALAVLKAREEGRWVFVAGNGGSASTAGHIANDLVKGCTVEGKKRIKAMSLPDALAIITALGNDIDYSQVFVEQLKNYAAAGDVFLAVSGSGNSPNVVEAARWAKENGLVVVAFTGRDGGKLKPLADINCIAATDSMAEIEDIHLMWEHALITNICAYVEAE